MRTFARRGSTALTAALSALLPLTCAVHAQTPPAPAETAPANPNVKPGDRPQDEPLSKKLDRNDGVLKPPAGIDPEMHKPTPDNTGDKMPIIIPPGEPGGDQSVQPQ